MIVYCTFDFEKRIEYLSGKRPYSNILADVCGFFSDKNTDELHIIYPLISVPQKYSLNKYRISNSIMNKGKSGSYRCVAVCLPENDSVYLDHIYPKTGSEGRDNLTKEEYKSIQSNIQAAIKNDDLSLAFR